MSWMSVAICQLGVLPLATTYRGKALSNQRSTAGLSLVELSVPGVDQSLKSGG
jgi:hypothetical protein